MRNSTLLKILLIVSIFFSGQINAQEVDDATYFARFITAQKHILGDGLPKDTTRAFELYKDCAENGNMPDAMNKIGIMYKKGFGTKKNSSKALHWFSKSTERGNSFGMANLGLMHKEGEGVPQDFQKAFEYFKASAEKNDPIGMYGMGYCSYKGLGTAQSYEEAVKWYRKSDEKNSAAATFMLGLCYRNGFGVERNEEEAIKFLEKASGKGNKNAKNELKKKHPEIEKTKKEKERDQLKEKNNKGNTPVQKEKFKKLLKHNNNISLDGTWVGTRYFYDWSRQHILREDSLVVILKKTGNHITGKWYENGKLLVNLKGVVIDEQIVFSKTNFTGTNRYGEKGKVEFKRARFETINADVNYLAGNVESYSPDVKEPGKPCYVVMTKMLQEKSAKTDSVIVENVSEPEINEPVNSIQETVQVVKETEIMVREALDYFKKKDAMFTAYPNPFKNKINVEYKTIGESEVAIYIYNSVGNLVLHESLGINQTGNHTKEINLDAAPGQYIIRLVINGEAYAQIIIKK